MNDDTRNAPRPDMRNQPSMRTVPAPTLVQQQHPADVIERASHLATARDLMAFNLGAHRADIRNWSVFANDGRLVGVVDRLLVEPQTGKVRYVCVEVAPHAAYDDRRNARGLVMIPIGLVRRTDERRSIEIDALSSDVIASAPRLHERPVTRADENATLAFYGMATSRDLPTDLYSGPNFSEDRLLLS